MFGLGSRVRMRGMGFVGHVVTAERRGDRRFNISLILASPRISDSSTFGSLTALPIWEARLSATPGECGFAVRNGVGCRVGCRARCRPDPIPWSSHSDWPFLRHVSAYLAVSGPADTEYLAGGLILISSLSAKPRQGFVFFCATVDVFPRTQAYLCATRRPGLCLS